MEIVVSAAKMRIGYLVNNYPAVSHTFIRREILALEKLGFEVVRYALRPGAKTYVDAEDARENSRTHFIIGSGALNFLAAVLHGLLLDPAAFLRTLYSAVRTGARSDRGVLVHVFYFVEAAVLAKWARRDGVQHIHAHFGTNPAAIAMFAGGLSGLPYSFTAHGPDEFENARLLNLDSKVAGAEFAVCVSQFGRSQLMRWTRPEFWSKIKLVHCGLDDKFLSAETPAMTDAPQMVCVARLGPEKGHLVLVAAVRRLHAEGRRVRLSLLGDGPMRPAIEAAIAEAGLGDSIQLLGWASGPQVKEELARSRVFVLPSFAENLPVVLMEALSMGRPVIATCIAGISELVLPGVNGWLVSAGDEVALANALREAIDATPERLAAMGEAGRDLVVREFNSFREAEKLKVWFEASVARGRSGEAALAQ